MERYYKEKEIFEKNKAMVEEQMSKFGEIEDNIEKEKLKLKEDWGEFDKERKVFSKI